MKHIGMLGMLLLLAGCGICRTETTPTPETTLLTADANGQRIHVAPGDIIEFKLAANPTTGYNWEITLQSEGEPVVAVLQEQFVNADTALVGAPGTMVYTLEALHTGETTVTARYFRPWEKFDPATDTQVEYTIEVKP